MRNRGLYTADQTWLYKKSGIGPATVVVAGIGPDPTYEALCYTPFQQNNPTCLTPPLLLLVTHVNAWVDLPGLLTLGAVNAIVGTVDEIFAKDKNFYFADFLDGTLRQYYGWDLDSSMPNGSLNLTLYGNTGAFQQILLGNATIRAQYSQILNDLVCGPLEIGNLIALLDALEPVLASALDQDLNNNFSGSAADRFESMRNWLTQRMSNVIGEIQGFQTCPPASQLATIAACAYHCSPPNCPSNYMCLDLPQGGGGGVLPIDPRVYNGVDAAHILQIGLTGPAVGAVMVDASCTDGSNPVSTSVVEAVPGMLTATFSPPLPSGECCTLTLSGGATGAAVIQILVGDVNRNGMVNATDKNLVKGFLGRALDAENFVYDVNMSGTINATDKFMVKGEIGQAAAICP